MKSKDNSERTEVNLTNEETAIDVNANRTEKVVKFKKMSDRQKSLLQSASSGLAGVSLAAVAMTLMGTSPSPGEDGSVELPSNTDNRQADGNDVEVPIFSEAPFSDAVNDEMSFNEAFGAARVDIGPGGFFEWHGETYNTYYKEEWDTLSPDEQNEFYASVDDKHDNNDVASEEEILDILNGDNDIETISDLDDHEDIVIDNQDTFDDVEIGDDVVVLDDDAGLDDLDNSDLADVDAIDDIDIVDDSIDISDLG